MNHGLMDQIAALHWIQECIGAFGGDPGSVTLLGHGTGAACIQFLMVSAAVVPGLFHRAILMSGSALSSWASVSTPAHYALQFGFALNCTGNLPSGLDIHDPELRPSSDEMDKMVNCLKNKPLDELNTVNIESPRFLYAFGPSVDGIVIKNDYKSEIHRLGEDSRKEYELMFGVVPQESYNDLGEKDLRDGFDTERRDKIFRTLVRNVYDYHLNEVFISMINEYTQWDRANPFPIEIRDTALSALSDARYVAPLVCASKNLRSGQKNQFFYVFNHSSRNRETHVLNSATHGSELPYIFGAPLVTELGIFSGNWTPEDEMVSEAMLSYTTNFVKMG
ncbi:Neuroligin-1 [Armadillidium vulgare]|nr:Neuroligin-1 [Armadillidium vulgare]